MAGRTYLRKKTYWIALSYKGVEYRRSALTDKKREAENLLSFYLGQVARGQFKGFTEQTEKYTLSEMLDDFIDDYERRGMRDVKTQRYRKGYLLKGFGDMRISDITERKIDLHIKSRFKSGRSRATVNRELQMLSQAFKLAKRKKLITEIPHIERFSEKGNARQGFFERDELERIVAFLPEYLQDVTRFAYCIGWRRGEILSLEWTDIQAQAIRLKPERDKAKDGRVIPLMGELAEIIQRRYDARVEECPYVFHRYGERIKGFKQAWGTARKRAGLPKKLFHDARRTVARNLDRAGVPRQVAKQIIGHKTDEMYNRYRIVNEEDMREGMQRYLGHVPHTPA